MRLADRASYVCLGSFVLSVRLQAGFSVQVACMTRSAALLARAEDEYDRCAFSRLLCWLLLVSLRVECRQQKPAKQSSPAPVTEPAHAAQTPHPKGKGGKGKSKGFGKWNNWHQGWKGDYAEGSKGDGKRKREAPGEDRGAAAKAPKA